MFCSTLFHSLLLLKVGSFPQWVSVGYRGQPSVTARLIQRPFHLSSNHLLAAGIRGHRRAPLLSAAEDEMDC